MDKIALKIGTWYDDANELKFSSFKWENVLHVKTLTKS